MANAVITWRERARKNLVVLFLVTLAITVAAVGAAPFVFLIWILKTVPHWLGF